MSALRRPAAETLASFEAAARRQELRSGLVELARHFVESGGDGANCLLSTAALLERAGGADVFDTLLASACRRAALAPPANWPQVRSGLLELLGSRP